eukprot:TRINITY_DN9642_c1_g2_i1.p1 TRINITY_DN9642_c1_g2~~TRINITY_DN9642_c1_g2_i1.p1  ORF type:complete len:282 (-),score=-39.81 TRINITY_DN9642_c1_g2_i1:284-1129(-)
MHPPQQQQFQAIRICRSHLSTKSYSIILYQLVFKYRHLYMGTNQYPYNWQNLNYLKLKFQSQIKKFIQFLFYNQDFLYVLILFTFSKQHTRQSIIRTFWKNFVGPGITNHEECNHNVIADNFVDDFYLVTKTVYYDTTTIKSYFCLFSKTFFYFFLLRCFCRYKSTLRTLYTYLNISKKFSQHVISIATTVKIPFQIPFYRQQLFRRKTTTRITEHIFKQKQLQDIITKKIKFAIQNNNEQNQPQNYTINPKSKFLLNIISIYICICIQSIQASTMYIVNT